MPENSIACPRFSLSKGIRILLRIPENNIACPRFSLSKGIRMLLRIPKNNIACPRFSLSKGIRIFIENTWEQRSLSSLLFIEGYSNADENIWECHTHPRFSLSKDIRMPMRIPENVIHILVSLYRRVFECRWDPSSFLPKLYRNPAHILLRTCLHLFTSRFKFLFRHLLRYT